eukprot:CAMPEP_0185724314 /NCGR_PEP_ID=MMETSP1171-20130828/828_1 /TAXON_ID=374046 /ORGANISM="Helicotheca tamensis, Strain CCMP826" /LENGTH=137 /DNA_ID=CAMNT_0028392133 /DNA_START=64 /DNA_END=477 /DNA_ORIENTATION=-
MNKLLSFLLLIAVATSTVSGFSVATPSMALSGVAGGSDFVVSQRPRPVAVTAPSRRSTAGVSNLRMGSMAKFGIFSPAVYGAKIVLGQDKLNKIRGKAISLHSQAIGDFCKWAGAYHLRTKLIKKAKVNGDTLGFLV